MKKTTRRIYNNCLLAALYLWVRGKADRVAFVTTISWKVPYHFVVITKNGHAIHFSHDGDIENSLIPFWFRGSLVGIRRSKQQEALTENNRCVYAVMNINIFVIFAIIFLWMASPIWIGGWMLYPLICMVSDMMNVGK